jgi:conjugative transfer signal peptidase TraF
MGREESLSPAKDRWPGSRSVLILTAVAFLLMLDAASPVGLSFNHSKSLPRGLYWHRPIASPLRRGELVCFHYEAPVWAKTRHYFPEGILLCKSVLGLPGDRLVKEEGGIAVCAPAGCSFAGKSLIVDSQGRGIPTLEYPAEIPAGKVFLSSTRVANSFDSRYLGLIDQSSLVRETGPIFTE